MLRTATVGGPAPETTPAKGHEACSSDYIASGCLAFRRGLAKSSNVPGGIQAVIILRHTLSRVGMSCNIWRSLPSERFPCACLWFTAVPLVVARAFATNTVVTLCNQHLQTMTFILPVQCNVLSLLPPHWVLIIL